MSYIQFKSYRNFYLHTDGWGVAQLNDIVVLLENVIKHFYSNLYRRRILSKQVFIKNSSNTFLLLIILKSLKAGIIILYI